ncbi:hypothetical protein KI387_006429, partial [Taxus chinensis]
AHVLHSFMLSVISFWLVQGPLLGFSLELTASLLSKDKQNAFGLMAPVQQGGEIQGFKPRRAPFCIVTHQHTISELESKNSDKGEPAAEFPNRPEQQRP